MTIELRQAHSDHLDDLLAVERASYFQPWSAATFLLALSHPKRIAEVAFEDTRLVGYVFGWTVADEAHLHNLCVAPTARGRGVAAKLFARFAALSRAAGATEASLEVRGSNLPALAFYRRQGFVVAGCRPDYYDLPREDALVMVYRFAGEFVERPGGSDV